MPLHLQRHPDQRRNDNLCRRRGSVKRHGLRNLQFGEGGLDVVFGLSGSFGSEGRWWVGVGKVIGEVADEGADKRDGGGRALAVRRRGMYSECVAVD